jgi:signal transduction histidine kinase
VQGFAQALVDGTASTPASQAQAARAIHEEAQRMRRMTETLLELARFEAEEITLERKPLDLAALVRQRSAHYQQLVAEAEIDLHIEAPEPMHVVGDTVRLTQVLDNLVSNAVRHTPSGGRIVLTVRRTEAQATLTVADTGEGIPEDALSRIFERFYRGDRARGGESTGLGLAIVQEIVRAHGGTVDVKSVEGIGTQFSVRLPLAT